MLVKDPFELLKGSLPKPKEITLEEVKKLIKGVYKNIHVVINSKMETDYSVKWKPETTVVSVKAFHYNGGILGEYSVSPQIVIDPDGTIRHVLRGIYTYSGMPKEVTIYTEEENSGVRCVNLRTFGINEKIWGFKDEMGEIVEAVELAEETKQTIIDRLKLDEIYVH